jgi:superfamily II DNA or RNA helicase
MELKPKKHQEKFAKNYKGKNILVHEGGTGKTICGCLWLKDGRDEDALVLAPKRVQQKWKEELKLWGTKATVMTDYEFKKTALKKWSAKVIDEADEYASPLFVAKKRSARSSKLSELTREYPDIPTLLLTATPVRSNGWNLHSILTFSGIYIDWKEWRKEFFELTYMPYLTRPAYCEKKGWQKMMQPIIEKYCDVVLLKDITDVPPVTE